MSDRTARHQPGELLLDRFVVQNTIFGGLGEVVVCVDRAKAGRLVALKTFPVDVGAEGEAALVKEAESWLRLKHWPESFFVGLEAIHRIGGRPYLQMEFYPSGSLKDVLEQGVPPLDVALDYLTSALCGMWEIGRAGFVHRDLKPGNVLIAADGRAVVSDFGLTRAGVAEAGGRGALTAVTGASGTPLFMAPELFLPDSVATTQTDIWAFGVMVALVLSGELPFTGETMGALIESILAGWYDREVVASAMDVDETVRWWLSTALAHRPSDRFANWTEAARAWEHVVAIGGNAPGSAERPVVARPAIVETWTKVVFVERQIAEAVAAGQTVARIGVARLRGYQIAEGFRQLGNYRTAISTIVDACGPLEKDSTLPHFLRFGEVLPWRSEGSPGPDIPDLLPKEDVPGIVELVLQAYAGLIEERKATPEEQGTANAFAHVAAFSSFASPTAVFYSGYIFAKLGKRAEANAVLWPFLNDPVHATMASNALFVLAVSANAREDATVIAAMTSERVRGKRRPMQAYFCANMWGVLGRPDQALEFARLAVQDDAAYAPAQQILIGSLWNLGHEAEASEALRAFRRIAPNDPLVAELSKIIPT